jgi:hypothetical protein
MLVKRVIEFLTFSGVEENDLKCDFVKRILLNVGLQQVRATNETSIEEHQIFIHHMHSLSFLLQLQHLIQFLDCVLLYPCYINDLLELCYLLIGLSLDFNLIRELNELLMLDLTLSQVLYPISMIHFSFLHFDLLTVPYNHCKEVNKLLCLI